MKAVLQFAISSGMQQQLQQAAPPWLQVLQVPVPEAERFAREAADAEVLLHVLEPVTPATLALAPKLRLVQKIGVGVNTIDLEACKARGVAVTNMPGTNSQAVAELTLTLMLNVLRRAGELDRLTKAGRGWDADPESFDQVGELAGRTVGLLGYGAIPQRLAPVLRALGARVLYWSRTPKPDAAAEWRDLPDLLAEAQVLSLHVPLTPETTRLLDAAAFARLPAGAVLVNTARGGLVDEPALVAALRSGHLAGAGLDVLAQEPAPAGNPLFDLPNVVVLPHVAWLTPETMARSVGVAIENCRRLRDGEPLLNRVV